MRHFFPHRWAPEQPSRPASASARRAYKKTRGARPKNVLIAARPDHLHQGDGGAYIKDHRARPQADAERREDRRGLAHHLATRTAVMAGFVDWCSQRARPARLDEKKLMRALYQQGLDVRLAAPLFVTVRAPVGQSPFPPQLVVMVPSAKSGFAFVTWLRR